VDLFAPVDTPHQFVFTTDVGPVVAGLVERPDGWNEVYHFAGSGLITVEDFARKVYAAAGEPYKRRLAAKWMIQAMGLFNRTMREFPEMHYLQTNPVNLADGKLEAHLGGLRRTAYDDGIALTLGTMREHPFAPMKQ
jgi:nucleoside-diphosphate-sugar epimerase